MLFKERGSFQLRMSHNNVNFMFLCVKHMFSFPYCSTMIMNLIGKPLTIALACVAVYLRTGASIPGLGEYFHKVVCVAMM